MRERGKLGGGNIRPALCVGKQASYITIMIITVIIDVVIRAVITLSLNGRIQRLLCLPCPTYSASMTSSECVIPFVITALSMFYLGKNSFRNISLILRTAFNIKVSHVTISNWCTRFAPLFDDMRIQLLPLLDLNSDEWHADETVVKIAGIKHYIWFVIDSETRFVIGFHLSPHRDSSQAVSVLSEAKSNGKPAAVVSDRYSAYKVPIKALLPETKHIRVQSFKDDISNNLIECFNKQFKAWYKTKQGFSSFASANNLISMFVFFFNFVRPHSALNGLTPAQVAGLNLSNKQKRMFPLVA